MPFSKLWVRTNGQLQSLHNFWQKFGSNCSFCLKMPLNSIWRPSMKIWTLQRPTHTLTSSSTNTHNWSENYVCMHWTLRYRQNLSITLKSNDLATRGFQNNFRHTHKTHWSRAQFQKGQPAPCKTSMLSLLTSGFESFGHKSTLSDRPWIEAYCPTF